MLKLFFSLSASAMTIPYECDEAGSEDSSFCPFMWRQVEQKWGTYSRPPYKYLIMEKQKVERVNESGLVNK